MANVLSKDDLLRRLQDDPPLIEHMIDPSVQVQVNGIDLTLQRVYGFLDTGSLDFSNQERIVATTAELDFDKNDWIHLYKGCYKVIYNEIVNIPKDIMALARPRSSLLRNGLTVETALWDSGYSGRSESLLIVINDKGCNLKKNARLIQLVFFRLSIPVENGYIGDYYRENIP